MTTTHLHVDMDGYRVGPGGQTLRELKADVVRARTLYMGAFLADEPGQDELRGAYDDATRMLQVAYVRMGLPYVAP